MVQPGRCHHDVWRSAGRIYRMVLTPYEKYVIVVRQSTSERDAAVAESQKVTYQISSSVVDEVREAVEHGYASSMSRFVEDALRRRLRDLQTERVRESCTRAAQDTRLATEIEQVEAAFECVDSRQISDG